MTDINYKFVVDPLADEPIMLLNGTIGEDVDGATFQADLLRLDASGKKLIKVYINSPGGSLVDGMGIFNAILKTKAKVDTYNVGLCASIAAVIFQAGRKRFMADYATIIFQQATGTDAKATKSLNDAMSVMLKRAGISDSAAKLILSKKESILNARQALSLGLCDEVELSTGFNTKHGNSAQASLVMGNSFINGIQVVRIHNMPNAINIMSAISKKFNQKS